MKKEKKGFTLIELIVVMAIMSMIGVIISSILVSTLNMNKKQSDKSDLQQNATFVKTCMSIDIRKATLVTKDSVSADWNNISSNYSGYDFKLYLETDSGKKIYYAYSNTNKNLLRITVVGSNRTSTVASNYLVKVGNVDGINVTGFPTATPDYYSIKVHLEKNNSNMDFTFIESLTNFGGDIE